MDTQHVLNTRETQNKMTDLATENRSKKLEKVTKIFYPSFDEHHWNKRIAGMTEPNMRVLEIGAGSGDGFQYRFPFAGKCKYSLGIDLDPRVMENDNFSETRVASAYQLDPTDIGKFDLIVSNFVAEHIDDSDMFVGKQLALLEDGGVAIHHTVSRFYYTSLLNLVFTDSMKDWLILNLGSGRPSEDIFPAFYLLNDARQLSLVAKNNNCDISIERYRIPPGYLRRSTILMMLYTIIDWPLSKIFPAIQAGLIFKITKKPKLDI